MKATTIILILAAGAIMASCSGDGAAPVNTTPVVANFSGNIKGTRATIDNTWGGTESIGVSGVSASTTYSNVKYTTSDASGNFSYASGNQIFYQDNATVTFKAYYPYAATLTGSDGTGTGTYICKTSASPIKAADETTVPSDIDYLYDGTSTGSQAHPSVGFTFAHEMSELTLKFVTGNGSLDVSNLTYTLTGGYTSGTFDTSSGTAVGTGTSDLAITTSNTATSRLILFPSPDATVMTLTLKVVISNVTYTAQLPIKTSAGAASAMLKNTNYTFNITVNASGLSVQSSSIGSWNSGASTDVTAS